MPGYVDFTYSPEENAVLASRPAIQNHPQIVTETALMHGDGLHGSIEECTGRFGPTPRYVNPIAMVLRTIF